MATLDKLLIRGVRSFAPDRTETLEFSTPLTIIVGHNGAGKTTIIECLKYSTTGDLPPNSKNGAFVYDPKLAHTSEVKAQVKLRFHNVRGQEVTCTRSLIVIQRLSSKTMRTLDSILSIKDPSSGEVHDLSSRCAVVDEELAPHLAVSKAILEHVVFCHQEDSFWPLSEPAALKKKFDEIFASTRYTKALVEIRDQKKSLVVVAKECERDLVHLRANKDKAKRVRGALLEVNTNFENTRARISQLDNGQVDDVVTQMTSHLEKQRSIGELTTRRVHAVHELDILRQRIQEISNNLNIHNEPEGELRQLLENYASSVSNQEGEQIALEEHKSSLDQNITVLGTQISGLYTRRGQLEAEHNAFKRQLKDRDDLAAELIKQYSVDGFDTSSLSDSDVDNFMRVLRRKAAEKQTSLEEFKSESKSKENSLSATMQQVRSDISTFDQTKRMYRLQIESTSSRTSELKMKMNAVSVGQIEIDSAGADLATAEAELEQARHLLENNTIEADLAVLQTQIDECERNLQQKSKEISAASLQMDTRARHAIKTAEFAKKTDMREKIMAELAKDVFDNLNINPPFESYMDEFDAALRSRQERRVELDQLRTDRMLQLSSITAKLNSTQETLKAKEAEERIKLFKITQICAPAEFKTALQNAEAKAIDCRDNLSSMNSAKSMYSKFIRKLKTNQCCPLCVRGFSDSNELDDFASKLELILERVPTAMRDAEVEAAKAEANLVALSDLGVTWSDYERLRTIELPDLRTHILMLESNRAQLQSSTDDDYPDLVAVNNAEIDIIRRLKSTTEEVTRVSVDIAAIERDIASISGDLGSSGATRTVGEIQREYEAIQVELKSMHLRLENLNQDLRNLQGDVQLRKNRVRDARETLEQLKINFGERARIATQIEELRIDSTRLDSEIKAIDVKSQEIYPQLDQLSTELSNFQRESGLTQNDLEAQVQRVTQNLNCLVNLQKEIERYNLSEGALKLSHCIRDTAALQRKIDDMKSEIETVTGRIERIQKHRSEMQVLQRTIDDNLKLRKLNSELSAIGQRIHAIDVEIQNFDMSAANTQYAELKSIHERLVSERAQLVGEQKQLEENARRLNKELQTDYCEIDLQFQEKVIELQLVQKSAHDLEIYAKALDRAIMTHHQHKMDEINKIIRELWTKTYRGLDIDTIEVRWDPEKDNSRSYNYRVVMVKGDTELDMRGRCSAGQKVLTSIIIRLALAETFCVNCGILALDEPTTNLDRENIESLAESLAEIIQTRRQQSNFQLIVITHDEEFMQLLGSGEFADFYYRVEKKADGTSSIHKEPMGNR
ncbi:hypothetical protein BASA61_004285 [Batrachochytrium salamandrivorans]|nr:hypothetical protein BASA60_007046 [Batrachochytrium salamandrivorans]KAH6593448.1 hypothetical protein BASA61_004285 [Batrachochytrium salamandrivorans]